MKTTSIPTYEDIKALFDRYDEEDVNSRTPLIIKIEPRPKCEPETSALDELMAMTGLREVKEQIISQVHYHRIMNIRKAAGKHVPKRLMHMIFTGNPGTGKTTVARLLGRIYKDAGLLRSGHLVEVSRAQIVGRYIGETEHKVSELIDRASGGVLFIDEAYSLVEENDGAPTRDFGVKAIDTLMPQLSETSDYVVIFAGYSSSMKKAMSINPGLESRFPVTLNFKDFEVDELLQIASAELDKQDLVLSEEALESMKQLLTRAKNEVPNFGNGRFVKTLINNHILPRLCSRLCISEDSGNIDVERTSLVEAADMPSFGELFPFKALQRRRIGFSY